MRQAGRYLPEFKKIRKENPNFIKLCLNSNLVNKITLQPLKRFDLDAAIIFSDILMIPYSLGQKVEFKKGEGPFLGDIDLDNIINTDPTDFIKRMLPVYKGIEKVRNNLKGKSLVGFAGAPWTLLLYMLNKESPKNNFNFDKMKIWNELGEIEATAKVSEDVLSGILVVHHGFWRRHVKGNTVNALIRSNPSKIGQGITVNDTIVFMKKKSIRDR